jgi:hypothetical protein
MKKIFFAMTFAVMLIFTNTCAAQDVFVGPWSKVGTVDYYIMDETIRDTTPPSAHDYRNFEVSFKLIDRNNGEVEDILTYSYRQISDGPWTHRLVRRENAPVPPTVDDLLFPAVNKAFEFCMERLGWSYTIKNGHYY